jgi:hypothetical protein
MTDAQKAAARAALDAFLEPLIEQASVFARGAIRSDQFRDQLVATVGDAVLAVPQQ